MTETNGVVIGGCGWGRKKDEAELKRKMCCGSPPPLRAVGHQPIKAGGAEGTVQSLGGIEHNGD